VLFFFFFVKKETRRKKTKMTFRLPAANQSASSSRKSVPVLEQQRIAAEANLQHVKAVTELEELARQQRTRIEKLKLDTAVQLEHRSTLRRLELEKRQEQALKQIDDLQPRLENVRHQWEQAKKANQGFELQWGSIRAHHQQLVQRADALRAQLADSKSKVESARTHVSEMREQLRKVERDKATLHSKMQRALECIVTDNEFLTTRVAEEETYHRELGNALDKIRLEYEESQSSYQHEFAPLQEDERTLSSYLVEMQNRTKELEKYCLELESKTSAIESHWLEAVHAVYEGLERAHHIDRLKSLALANLEGQIQSFQEQGVGARTKAGQQDSTWLANAVLVWESVLQELAQERQRMQIRNDYTQQLAETSQKTEQAKATIATIKSKVEGTGLQRRQLLLELLELHYLANEKRDSEEQLVHYLQEVATQLEEDLSKVVGFVRKDGFDDYVTSSDHEDEHDGQAEDPLAEEGMDDIANLVSSIDLDPSDENTFERIQAMSRRPEGPLRAFAMKRAASLAKIAQQKAVSSSVSLYGQKQIEADKTKKPLKETLERAVQDTFLRVISEVVANVKQRHRQIEQGLLDPRQERVQADQKYIVRAKDMAARAERWIQQQKDERVSKKAGTDMTKPSFNLSAAAGGSGPLGIDGNVRIVIEGERIPPDVVRVNMVGQAFYYLTQALHGFQFMMYLRRTMAPQLRHVFLTRDLSKFIARRIGGTEGENTDDIQLRVADVKTILLGHKTDVFKDVRSLSKIPLREENAFSMVSVDSSTIDLETDSQEDRTHRAAIYAWIVNECRSNGIITALVKAGRVEVIDTRTGTKRNDESVHRPNLEVRIAGSQDVRIPGRGL
jgi:predicted  nucleic acid-binding Zn-ribbon protein